MNFILTPPSLKQRTLVQIAVTLWSQGDARYWISKLYPMQEGRWQEIEEIIDKKASKLPLPATLKKMVLDIIEPVGIQVQSWMEFHTNYCRITKLPATLFWTPHGTIDYKRTIEVLVKDDTLDVQDRFAWACFYCLEDDIVDLRNKCIPVRGRMGQDKFAISFWCAYLEQTDDFHRTQTILEYFLTFVAHSELTAIRYLCLKLSNENSEQLRVRAARCLVQLAFDVRMGSYLQRYSANLCFLLSAMNVKQQTEMFVMCAHGVLKCLLVWPRHTLFLKAAKFPGIFFDKNSFHALLHNIVDGMSCKSNYLRELFGEFWLQAPEAHKQLITTDTSILRTLLLVLFDKDDRKNIKLILDDLSISAREKFIYCHWGRDLCNRLATSGKSDSLRYLIQECIPSPGGNDKM